MHGDAHSTGSRERKVRSLNAEWDGRPAAYEDLRQCWLNERRERFLCQQLHDADLGEGDRVLEIGCGTGWLLRRLAARFGQLQFVGLDPDASYVRFAQEHTSHPNERYIEGWAESLPDVGLGFSTLLSNDVLHHVGSITETVRRAAEVARPGAQWLVIEPNYLNPYTFARQRFTAGERNFFPAAATRAAEQSGWHCVARTHLFLIPPFVRAAPGWMIELERRFERVPVLAGGVFLRLVRNG